MTEYDNTNRGVLFRETGKKSDKAPDYKGRLNVGGHEYELAGWIRTSKAGNKFLSVSVSEPWQGGKSDSQRNQDAQRPAGGGGQSAPADFDDDIPFVRAMTTEGRP